MTRAGSAPVGWRWALHRTPATLGVALAPERQTNAKAYSYDKDPESSLTRSDIGRWH